MATQRTATMSTTLDQYPFYVESCSVELGTDSYDCTSGQGNGSIVLGWSANGEGSMFQSGVMQERRGKYTFSVNGQSRAKTAVAVGQWFGNAIEMHGHFGTGTQVVRETFVSR